MDASDLKMQFTDRVRAVWSWLPAFRAVAETQHLPSAARAIDVVPSALSRSVKLLEESIGAELFDHGRKTLVLNDAGRRVLDAVRQAMRMLDEAVLAARGDEMRGTVTLAVSCDVQAMALVPACTALHEAHPQLEIAIRSIEDDAIAGLLQRGEIDAAVTTRLPRDNALGVMQLASLPRGAYVRRGAARPDDERVPVRCIAIGAPHRPVDDGWPSDVPRRVMLWATDEAVARDLCRQTGLVLAIADVAMAGAADFERLGIPAIRSQAVYAVHRPTLGAHRRTDAVLAAIRESFAARA